MAEVQFSPGSVVKARGREWIVLGGSSLDTLKVRPVAGSEEDHTLIHLPLEVEPVTAATFPLPALEPVAGHDAALLLRDALLLSLRRGAGPFRSFGQISVEPRGYQLLPLLMALKQDTVRLLIADDVGVGKTIEAGLIARELLDRGEIDRTAVLCPPHLVEQWVKELGDRFHIRAVAVTAAGAARLEKGLPPSESIFTAYPHTVVSLDYIKSEKRRTEFLRACPGFVIVDEAHTCAATGAGRHQRHELLRGLAESKDRHMVLLTATPHSGDDEAFHRLLGLLHPKFQNLLNAEGADRDTLRAELAKHFVQRRRPDIDEWHDGTVFPRRETTELRYQLNGAWETFFDHVLDYCEEVVKRAGDDERRQRLNFWGTLALMRCVASSPAAAVQALRTRAGHDQEDEGVLEDRLFDGASDALPDDDVEPPAAAEGEQLKALIAEAEGLKGVDPKLEVLIKHVKSLLEDGFSPVVFCRYIATAHHVAAELEKQLKRAAPKAVVGVVTGEIASAEREEKVDLLGEAEQRVLVATDCLSEGINLQEHFDAVVHYDLSWNPTRHEQREGRVDRFGQTSKKVRTTLMYGANNPVDGAVLEVIIRKADKIRRELGVPVPMPDENHALTQALMKAVLLRHRPDRKQASFSFLNLTEAENLDQRWQDAAEKAQRNRTVFAQRRMKPEDVLPEWHKALAAVGGQEDVKRFANSALKRLGAALEPYHKAHKVPLDQLPEDVKERLEADGMTGTLHVDFKYPPDPRCRAVQRSHPLVTVLADALMERSLGAVDAGNNDPGVLGRVGCWTAPNVTQKTTIVLLRLRHQLSIQKDQRTSTLLVEEATAVAWTFGANAPVIENGAALSLLLAPPAGDPAPVARDRAIKEAVAQVGARTAELEAYANRRAQLLLSDHRRVREAADSKGRYAVKAILPVDVVAIYVLLPKVD